MRFAYIDSQGKEVSIPGVDALRLRIELGAIGDDTMFYDSSGGKWAAAAEHEIFRTLKRELAGRDGSGYVAPPPPVDAEEGRGADDDEVILSTDALAPTPEPDEGPQEPPRARRREASPEAPRARRPDTPPVSDPPARPSQLAPDPFSALDGPGTGEPGEADDVEPAPDAEGGAEPQGGGSEWDLGMELTLDDGVGPDQDEIDEAEPAASVDDGDDPHEPESFDFGSFGAVEFDEPAAVDDADHIGFDGPGDLGLEPSLADYSADAPPSWMAPDEDPHPDPDAPPAWTQAGLPDEPLDEPFPDRDAVRRKMEARRAVEARGGRTTPTRPPTATGGVGPQRRPVRKRGRGGTGILVAVVVVAVGVAGWSGIRAFAGGSSVPEAEPVVEVPEIPARLEPNLRTLSVRATGTMVDGLMSLPAREAVAAEPDQDWLGGRYMATASQYGGIAGYWRDIGAWVDDMRQSERGLFVAAFEAEVAASTVPADDKALLLDRGIAGFDAAAPDRNLVYGQLAEVARAALSLHEFLEANEPNIDFEPAEGGLSRDPVLEAVPASEELGDEMWDRVGEITDALDALGLLDRVTTDRLGEVFFEKLRAIPIR